MVASRIPVAVGVWGGRGLGELHGNVEELTVLCKRSGRVHEHRWADVHPSGEADLNRKPARRPSPARDRRATGTMRSNESVVALTARRPIRLKPPSSTRTTSSGRDTERDPRERVSMEHVVGALPRDVEKGRPEPPGPAAGHPLGRFQLDPAPRAHDLDEHRCPPRMRVRTRTRGASSPSRGCDPSVSGARRIGPAEKSSPRGRSA